LKPTREAPLALTVEQRSEFPKSDSGFRTTTEGKATMIAERTEAEPEKLPQVPPAPGSPEPATRTAPVTPAPEETPPAPEETEESTTTEPPPPDTEPPPPDTGPPEQDGERGPAEQQGPS
jgi:hypothetical protein